MGFEFTMNWVLKTEPPSKLGEGLVSDFEKQGNRLYPLGIGINMMNLQREVIAKVEILEFTNVPGRTYGKYKIIKVHKETEKDFLTKSLAENKQGI